MSNAAVRVDRGSHKPERLYSSLLAAATIEQVYALALDAMQELLNADRAYVLLPDSNLLLATHYHELRVGRGSDAVIAIRDGDRILAKCVLNFEQPRDFGEMDVTAMRLIAMHAATAVRQLKMRESIAMVVHELATPLHVIAGAVEMLRSNSSERRELAVDMVGRNVRIQGRLLDDLLSVMRIQAGKVQIRKEAVNLAGVLRDAVDASFSKAVASGTVINVDDYPGPLIVYGDSDRLRQIFWNLLSNAVRYCSPNGHVTVRTKAADGELEIRVADDGIGIAPGALPYIFEPFHQGERKIERTETGLGLGLAIAKQLIEMHGGCLTAESEGVGKGSTFIVRFVLAKRSDIPA